MMQTLEKDLKDCIEGEIHFDTISKKIYSVDASIYEIEPLGIVVPKHTQDLINVLKIAHQHQTPIIARGAATGITGGCLGKGLIVDTSKYLNKILEIDYTNEYAICEPGVVQDQLNNALAAEGYRLGPDTSTGNRATLGGMLGNNSSGSRSLKFGKMSDHVESIDLALYNGSIITFNKVDEKTWQEKLLLNTIEGNIYREVECIREQYKLDIETHFPKIPKRVSGYNLDALLKSSHPNLCELIVGSEGTFGIATKIKVKIVKKSIFTGLCLIHFDEMINALEHVEEILSTNPIAFEMIDDHIIEMGKQSPAVRNKMNWLQGNPEVIFALEYEGSSKNEVHEKIVSVIKKFSAKKLGYSIKGIFEKNEIEDFWSVRKSGLGLLLSKKSYSRAIAFVEDITVAPHHLAQFISEFRQSLLKYGKDAGIYGHAGSGCMHVRPYIDLRSPEELLHMADLMHDTAELLLKYGGAFSGEHGDGIVRTWLTEKMFGERLYQAFVALKSAFDPENRMNPGKIVHPMQGLQENLRLNPEIKPASIQTFLDFSREGGFGLAVDLCNGNGMCRKKETVMCPSFHATGDEYHTTRARAQTLRSIVNGRLPLKEFTGQGLHDVMDLCLECKGCKKECPSQVDMAKMKAEFLYHYQKENGTTLRTKFFAHLSFLSEKGAFFPNVVNYLQESKLGKLFFEKLGVAPERTLPKMAKEPFSKWLKRSASKNSSSKFVVLFNDTFSEFFYPNIGMSAYQLLTALGYTVIVPPRQCCGRPLISKGLLEEARMSASQVVDMLMGYVQKQIPIIGLEPSCIFTIKDDFRDLLGYNNEKAKRISDLCVTLDQFLMRLLDKNELIFPSNLQERKVKVHGHCHQKALIGTKDMMDVLKAIPGWNVAEIESGCCGMAGSFGYEKEHYEMSMQIGEKTLFPAVRESDNSTIIIANGASCRSQIAHGTGREALHLAEALYPKPPFGVR